jgi:copper/silver efflux system protein
VFFSMAIILLAFVPVFVLTGQEGKLFHPLAFTKTFAVLGAAIIAVTLVPVLCTVLLVLWSASLGNAARASSITFR